MVRNMPLLDRKVFHSGMNRTHATTKRTILLDIEKVERARLRQGLYRYEVAAAARLGKSTVYQALRTGHVGIKVARAIAGALGLDLADLWIDRGPVRHG